MSSAVCVERIALAATVALWFGLLLHVIVAAERSVLVLMVLVLAVLVMVLVVLVTLMLKLRSTFDFPNCPTAGGSNTT